MDRLIALGADHVIVTEEEDPVARVQSITGGKASRIVFDPVGGEFMSETDLPIIRQHRGTANRLGYAVQLCTMRYPGIVLGARSEPFPPLLHIVAPQLKVSVENWIEYGKRAETRREHALELQEIFGFQTFTIKHYRAGVRSLEDIASSGLNTSPS